jgi:hypothetical protein
MFGISKNLLLENEDENSSPNRSLASEAASEPAVAEPENEEASSENEVAEARAELMKFTKENRLKLWKAMQRQNEQNDPILYDLLKEEFGDLEESIESVPAAAADEEEEEFELNDPNEVEELEEEEEPVEEFEEEEELEEEEEPVEEFEEEEEEPIEEFEEEEEEPVEEFEEEEEYPEAIEEEEEEPVEVEEIEEIPAAEEEEEYPEAIEEEPAEAASNVEPEPLQPAAENNQGLKAFLAGKTPEQLEMMWRMDLEEADRALVQAEFEKRGIPLPSMNNNNNNSNSNNNNNGPTEFASLPPDELLELWDTETDFTVRDKLVKELQTRGMFPSAAMTEWEYQTGAYPDLLDPEFLKKLLAKREFAESLQHEWRPSTDPCVGDSLFEVTPVQRFISNFMSPKTPYMSALLFHGVGVGKTCAAVQITEAWLEYYPQNEVYLIAPPTIREGFYRTIFDSKKIIFGEGSEPNSASQCTGTTYMKLTNTLYERDINKIERAVKKLINKRYKVFGYVSFAKFIEETISGIPTTIPKKRQREIKIKRIRDQFSGKLLIVDEAHNLRDQSLRDHLDIDEKEEAFSSKAEQSDALGGKYLTPFLEDVLRYAEGMKFCALTATPMYNTYKEIIFILNLLLLNDKKATISEADVFDPRGTITPGGAKILSYISQRYVSFMRGENPISFPVRLFPLSIPAFPAAYPSLNPRGALIPESERDYYTHLPLVPILLGGDSLQATLAIMKELPPATKGREELGPFQLDLLVPAGNIIVPPTPVTQGTSFAAYKLRTDSNALLTVFTKETIEKQVQYKPLDSVGVEWLTVGPLATYSPKFDFLIRRIQRAEGCIFVYTRFVNSGAISIGLALEANGYTLYGRTHGLLGKKKEVVEANGGRQCALCPRREKQHGGAEHAFSPAYYGLLTGNASVSPHNNETIAAQRADNNVNGVHIKVVIGSQIASEGVDFRFVRETHVIDSWYHLNKTEQILGRAIRFRSHCMLPKLERNNTVYLYATVLPPSEPYYETADLYSYRNGFKKAVLIGRVTRAMKQSAIDCNLNQNAIIIRDQAPIEQLDSQGVLRREVNINDTPFTAVCDWIETCDYQCTPQIDVEKLTLDDSTYDEYSARWRVNQMKQRLRILFERQPFYQSEDLWNLLTDIPRLAKVDLLREIVNNKAFQITHNGMTGYIRYCNKYYLFQPNVYMDVTIPLAIRVAKFPIKRDMYIPMEYEAPAEQEEQADVVNTSDTILDTWNAIVNWIDELSVSEDYIKEPFELNEYIIKIANHNNSVIQNRQKMLSVIPTFHAAFQESKYVNTNAFRNALLFYFWDEWLSVNEQNQLIQQQGEAVEDCIKDSQFEFDENDVVNRLFNPKTGEVEYRLPNGEPCSPAVIDAIHQDRGKDPVQFFHVTQRSTGSLYGFLVPKYGKIVFKTSEPPEAGAKFQGRKGSECAIVSGKGNHYENLIKIGEILKASPFQFDFHLNEVSLVTSLTIKNPTRLCTLMNLFLRFLDAEEIENKRWFIRAVQAFYSGHIGMFRASKK